MLLISCFTLEFDCTFENSGRIRRIRYNVSFCLRLKNVLYNYAVCVESVHIDYVYSHV